jgi:hypothetical protein
MNNHDAIAKLKNPATREEGLRALGRWAAETCLTFGVKPEQAFYIAALFTRGMRRIYEPETEEFVKGMRREGAQ